MIELAIYENGVPVGTLQAQREGLFWVFSCKIRQTTEQIRRIYVVSGWRTEYLGIPYPCGEEAMLTAHVPAKHLPDELTGAVATTDPRGQWLPWCGETDGVPVFQGYFRTAEDGIELALLPEEAQMLPEWLPLMQPISVMGRERLMIKLDKNGMLPPRNTENGGNTYDTETFVDSIDSDLPVDAAADDGDGLDRGQTDRADL